MTVKDVQKGASDGVLKAAVSPFPIQGGSPPCASRVSSFNAPQHQSHNHLLSQDSLDRQKIISTDGLDDISVTLLERQQHHQSLFFGLEQMADEIHADKTPGFKVGEKKTLEEYHKLGEFVFCPRSSGSIRATRT